MTILSGFFLLINKNKSFTLEIDLSAAVMVVDGPEQSVPTIRMCNSVILPEQKEGGKKKWPDVVSYGCQRGKPKAAQLCV